MFLTGVFLLEYGALHEQLLSISGGKFLIWAGREILSSHSSTMSDLSDNPSIERWLQVAESHLKNGDFTDARKAAETANKLSPGNPRVVEILNRIEQKEKEEDSSLVPSPNKSPEATTSQNLTELLAKFKVLSSTASAEGTDASPAERIQHEQQRLERKSQLIDRIDGRLSDGEFEKALELIDSALLEFPRDTELEQLEEEAQKGIEDKNTSEELLHQGRLLTQSKKHDAAIVELEKAWKLDPPNPEIRELLVENLLVVASTMVSTDWKAAEGVLQRIISLDPKNEQVRQLRQLIQQKQKDEFVSRSLAKAREHQVRGQLESAEMILRGGLERYPDESRILRLLNIIVKSRQTTDQQDLVVQLESQVKSLLETDQYDEAKRQVANALQNDPSNSRLVFLLESVETAFSKAKAKAKDQIRALSSQTDPSALQEALSLTSRWEASDPEESFFLDHRRELEKKISQSPASVERHVREPDRTDEPESRDVAGFTPGVEDKGEQTPALTQESAEQKRKALKVGLIVAAVAILLLVMISTVKWLSRPRYSEVNIASKPPGARVYVDNQEIGVSGSTLRIAVPRGGARLNFRLSLENHRDHTGVIDVKPNETYSVGPFMLEEILQVSSELREMYEKAVQAYNDKNWFEPEGQSLLEYANQLLSMDPDNRNGVKAKTEGLLSGVKDEFLNQWQNLPKRDAGTERELDVLELLVKVDPENPDVKERMEIIRGEAERIKGEIRIAINKNNFFPPEGKNAWDLLNELDKRFRKRERPYRQSRLTEMAAKVSSLATDKCRGSNPKKGECVEFVSLALNYFQENPILQQLRENSKERKETPPVLPKGPDPIQTRLAGLDAKMTAAFPKRCVVPETDSVLFYANEILKLDDSNRRALDLRGECRGLANSEAAQLSDREQSRTALSSPDEARKVIVNLERATKIYQAIHSFWNDDLQAPTRLKDLSVRLELINKLLNTGDSFPVSHLHGIGGLGFLGRCDGDLTLNGYQVKYTPNNKKKHNDIVMSYSDLKDIALDGGKLGITTADRKSNKFKAQAEDEKQSTEQMRRIQNRINELKAVRDTLAEGTKP